MQLRDATYRLLLLKVLIGTPRVSHVLKHNFTDLKRAFSESNLQDLNVTSLKDGQQRLPNRVVQGTHFFIIIAICHCEKTRSE